MIGAAMRRPEADCHVTARRRRVQAARHPGWVGDLVAFPASARSSFITCAV